MGREEIALKSSKFSSVALQFCDPVSERIERSKVGDHRRRKLASLISLTKMVAPWLHRTQNPEQTLSRHHLKDVCHWPYHIHSHNEVDILLKKFEEEKMAWKIKEQDKIHTAITAVARELKIEKKLKKQTERLNKKLGRELADTKASLSKAVKELEGEKGQREILEQVCDELARGLGEDRAEMEELKRQSAKIREEVEMEQKMLQLADVMREERVQMKLSEAKYQFEEKNAVLDKLRNELEAYLRSKGPRRTRIEESQTFITMEEHQTSLLNLEKDHADETERYKMIKDLCDRIVSASRKTSSQGFSGPTMNSSQQKLSANDPNKVMGRALPSCREKLEVVPEFIKLSCRELLE
ncbi:hypothetical protein HAX54_003354 [Datura stramonium]|uniref:Uncharacterized protein n=1 Tax=Datura stramonium TaxID=4076 RepID=A0ABS8T5Z1_DATST|nr:hypothetical protein [Datura stramonium]